MEMGREAEGMLLLELARAQAESAYAQNPLDADNLARWGGALMELSQFQGPRESKIMLLDAASKLEEALVIDPKKHHAMWCLANAHTTHGLMIPDIKEAEVYFMKAAIYFQQAIEEDPGNEVYMKSLEIVEKASELHAEIHKHSQGQGGGASFSDSSKTSRKKKKSNDTMYDVMGWVILGVGILAWIGFAKNHMPPPPPI